MAIADLKDADHIVLSAGGNDALQHIDLLEAVTGTTPRDVLVRLWSIREEFRRSYAALLDCLALACRPVLVYKSAVSIIDDVIQREGRRRSFDILELRTLFHDRADYANPIEPSASGGFKLAKCLSDWVTGGRPTA